MKRKVYYRVYQISQTVSGSIPGDVTEDSFRSYRQNHVPGRRLSL